MTVNTLIGDYTNVSHPENIYDVSSHFCDCMGFKDFIQDDDQEKDIYKPFVAYHHPWHWRYR